MLTIFDHPCIEHKLAILRNKNTKTIEFDQCLSEIGSLMAYEVLRNVPTKEIDVETPMGECKAREISKEIVLIPILRAGLGFLDGIRKLVPTAKVGFVGLYRDEKTLEPHEYYAKFPKMDDAMVIMLEPMIATGGSTVAAVDIVKARGAKEIKMVSLVAAPQGIEKLQKAHPDVDIYLASLDEGLNDIGYIVPGLGDAGDRIWGTK